MNEVIFDNQDFQEISTDDISNHNISNEDLEPSGIEINNFLDNLEDNSDDCSSPANSLDLNYPEMDSGILEEIHEKLWEVKKKEESVKDSVDRLEKLFKNKDGENIADILTNLYNLIKEK